VQQNGILNGMPKFHTIQIPGMPLYLMLPNYVPNGNIVFHVIYFMIQNLTFHAMSPVLIWYEPMIILKIVWTISTCGANLKEPCFKCEAHRENRLPSYQTTLQNLHK
jgi:hypothetical protein